MGAQVELKPSEQKWSNENGKEQAVSICTYSTIVYERRDANTSRLCSFYSHVKTISLLCQRVVPLYIHNDRYALSSRSIVQVTYSFCVGLYGLGYKKKKHESLAVLIVVRLQHRLHMLRGLGILLCHLASNSAQHSLQSYQFHEMFVANLLCMFLLILLLWL